MGAGQSQPEERPKVVRIEKEEIPEEYRTVAVSSDVVRRVASQKSAGGSENTQKLRAELEREKAEKARLREEMAQLSALQARAPVRSGDIGPLSDDIEERKRIFDETVERVEQKFFGYQRENVCRDNEQIMDCLSKNRGKVLKCKQLAEAYENCVAGFRQQVLSGN